MTSNDKVTEYEIELLLNLKNVNMSKHQETKIIFDWDDTLYPTTWITSNSYLIENPSDASENIKDYFKQLSNLILFVIRYAKRYGEVIIITNAQEIWIEKSCCLMPELLLFLKTIDVISSQDKWKHLTPLPEKWKEYEFLEIAKKFIKSNKSIIKIICIGDSDCEHDASKKAVSFINDNSYDLAYLKNFVFKNQPTFEELLLQIQGVPTYLYEILGH